MPPSEGTSPKSLPYPKSKDIPIEPISIYTFPSFNYVTIPAAPDVETYQDMLRHFVKGYALPDEVHPELARMDPGVAEKLIRDLKMRSGVPYSAPVNEAMILICGHGNRDMRCGVMGPLLQAEFEEKLGMFDMDLVTEPPEFKKWPKWATHGVGAKGMVRHKGVDGAEASEIEEEHIEDILESDEINDGKKNLQARVGQISHIGGHKFAGNVIVYIPKSHRWKTHPLAGKGIWYGRVEPWHVEGIIEQTIKQGVIIKELFRGGVSQSGKRVWLD
jgi:(2Fe-2S) ferredoxin